MLKHSLFSEFYLSRRHAKAQPETMVPRIVGALAVSVRPQNKPIILCRANSRTWWESGWQNRR